MTFSQSLMSLIVDELQLSKPESTKFVFGDNTRFEATICYFFSHFSLIRGLLQLSCFESYLQKSGLDPSVYEGIALSSIYQMSKVLNCADDGRKFRYYKLICCL